jgi:hypothetical protein
MIPIKDLIGPVKDEATMEIRETYDPECLHYIVVNKKSQQGYNVKIITDKPENEIEPGCKVKVSCNCDNFQFQWAYVLYKNDGLYNPHRLVLTPPVEKNPNMIIGACKHIKLALTRKLSHNIQKISKVNGEI